MTEDGESAVVVTADGIEKLEELMGEEIMV
jgi:hypothetical protein